MPTNPSASSSSTDDSDDSETLWSCSVVVQEKPYEVIDFSNVTHNKSTKESNPDVKGQQQKQHNKNIDSKKQKALKYSKGVSKKTTNVFSLLHTVE